MNLQALYLPDGFPIAGPPPPTGGPFGPNLRSDLAPALFSLECRECAALALLVIAERTTGVQAIVLHELVGGISSPHSPDIVRYFLDQAHRSRTMGALSAALAMYRADTSLVWQVDGLFLEILDAAYERPARSRTRLEEGQRRARELQGRSETTT